MLGKKPRKIAARFAIGEFNNEKEIFVPTLLNKNNIYSKAT